LLLRKTSISRGFATLHLLTPIQNSRFSKAVPAEEESSSKHDEAILFLGTLLFENFSAIYYNKLNEKEPVKPNYYYHYYPTIVELILLFKKYLKSTRRQSVFLFFFKLNKSNLEK